MIIFKEDFIMKRIYIMTVIHSFDADKLTKAFLTEEEAIKSMNKWIEDTVEQEQEIGNYTPQIVEVDETEKTIHYNNANEDFYEDYSTVYVIDVELNEEMLYDLCR
jgi:hypothetical protein